MSKLTLYLFIGYPGAGKTTVAKNLAEVTGAVHLWADQERHKFFPNPTHSHEESDALYAKLNDVTEYLLAEGKSVIFDTNFNYFADREKLREIASKYHAETIILWISTPVEVARDRAVCSHEVRNGYEMNMTNEQFDDIVSKLEPPTKDEKVIKIDNPKLDAKELLSLVSK
jgi:predicted kinase